MDKTVVIVDKESEDSSNKKSGSFDIFSKLLNKRNLKVILLILVGILFIVLLFGFDNKKNKEDKYTVSATSNGYISTIDYCKLIEDKLIEVLSAVDGAGQVNVMITVDGSPELVYANEKDQASSTNSSGSVTASTYSSPIIINANGTSTALVMTEILPAVKGVIVKCCINFTRYIY